MHTPNFTPKTFVASLALVGFTSLAVAQGTTTPTNPSSGSGTLSSADQTFLQQAIQTGLSEQMASDIIADLTSFQDLTNSGGGSSSGSGSSSSSSGGSSGGSSSGGGMNTADQVLAYAKQMSAEHGMFNAQLQFLAQQKGVNVTVQLPSNEATAIQQLVTMNGTNAQTYFIQTFGVTAHQTAIALFQKEASSGTDPQVKALAQLVLPHLQEHLTEAQQIQSGGGIGGSSSGGSSSGGASSSSSSGGSSGASSSGGASSGGSSSGASGGAGGTGGASGGM
jgi:putative membrane protein